MEFASNSFLMLKVAARHISMIDGKHTLLSNRSFAVVVQALHVQSSQITELQAKGVIIILRKSHCNAKEDLEL